VITGLDIFQWPCRVLPQKYLEPPSINGSGLSDLDPETPW
jgi:hypothetical protein